MFQPVAPILSQIMPEKWQDKIEKLPNCETLNQGFAYKNQNQKQLRFIQQDENLPYQNLGYEQRIFEHGLIATRKNNWHDFFNALVWKTFPRTKIALNAIHYHEIHQQVSTLRSKKRDLLTLFDECGVIIIAKNSILDLVQNHRWHELFIKNKQAWLAGDIKIITFGHAMYEKYLTPYIGMTAKALLLNVQDTPDNLDIFLAKKLINNELLNDKKELSPLPVLGIPNWHKNQDAQFYANQNYFR